MNPAVVLEPQDQIPCDIEIRGFAAVEGLVWCANGNGTISVRDASTAKETFQVTRYDRDPAWCLDSVSTPEDPGTATVWIGYSSGTIRVYSALGSHMNDLSYHQAGVTAMRSHKGVSIFTGDQNATIAQWCVQAQSVQRTFQAHTGPIRVLHLVTHSIFAHPFATEKGTVGSFENKYSLLSGSDDCTVRKWPLLPNKSIKEQSPPSEVKQGLDKTNPSSAQQDVITVGGDVAVLHNGPVRCITTAAGHIWSGGEETAVRITSMEVPHRVVAFPHASLESPPSFLYNPLHTELVFVANIDRTVVLWDAKALTPLYTLSNTKQGYVHSIAVIEEALLQSLTIWTSATDSTLHRWNVSVPTDSAVSQVVENTNGTSSPRGLRASDSEVYNLRNEVLHLRNREAHFHQRITSVQNMIDLVQNQREDMDRRHQLEVSRLGKVSSMIPSIERKALDAMASARGMHDGGVVINHLKELLDLLRGKRDGATTVSTRRSHSGGPSHSASTQRGYSATRHQSIKIPSTAPRISVSSILAPMME